MAPYSMDLRTRVLRDSDGGMSSNDVATKYSVSRAWVDRVKQRRRETGEVAPRKQTKFRSRTLTADQEQRLVALITARPDATLVELRAALPTTAALSTLWRTIGRFGLTAKKNGTRRRTATSRRGGHAETLSAAGRPDHIKHFFLVHDFKGDLRREDLFEREQGTAEKPGGPARTERMAPPEFIDVATLARVIFRSHAGALRAYCQQLEATGTHVARAAETLAILNRRSGRPA